MLYNLLQHLDRDIFEPQVISLTADGFYEEKIRKELGIKVTVCNLREKKSIFRNLAQCFKLCKDTDIIQSWMYHSNLIGFAIAKLLKKKIAWGIHHSNLDVKENKFTTVFIAKFSALLSKKVDKIISCGENVRKIHNSIGYSQQNHQVIVNGFDTEKFKITEKRSYYVENFESLDDKQILLHVGRWDPLKDYNNLLGAIALLKKKRSDFILFLVGTNLDDENEELINLIKHYDVLNETRLLGRRTDIPKLMASANIFVLSSSGEGLPNVLGEAMASGTCCVTTDVGDCGGLVGEFGQVVPPKNSAELAKGIENMMNWDASIYNANVINGRKKIEQHYALEKVVVQYENVYKEMHT